MGDGPPRPVGSPTEAAQEAVGPVVAGVGGGSPSPTDASGHGLGDGWA